MIVNSKFKKNVPLSLFTSLYSFIRVSLNTELDSPLENGTGTWDWIIKLECGTGIWDWNSILAPEPKTGNLLRQH